jgi:hypothetical protein
MNLRIQTSEVWHVLLADGWYRVAADPNDPTDSSFDVDTYAYVTGDDVLIGGGPIAGMPSTGFAFTDRSGRRIRSPLPAILAVGTSPHTSFEPPVTTYRDLVRTVAIAQAILEQS